MQTMTRKLPIADSPRLIRVLGLLTVYLAMAGRVLGSGDAAVTVQSGTVSWSFADTDGGDARAVDVQQVVLENEYVRALIVPSLGGRIARLVDKTTDADVFLRVEQPIPWNVERRFSAYNSQLGGVIVNFPCFHHGNSFSDNWNWQVETGDDGAATVVMGWTDTYLRQRLVVRVSLAPGKAALASEYRFFNLNPFAMGFAPWINTLFPNRDDLQWIIPSQQVVPHGFNAGTLTVLPWSWPDVDDESICFWRNAAGKRDYVSVFALDVERDFAGAYYHELDRGMARIFDRREQRGVKLWHGNDIFELWYSPSLLHEDALWWEGYGTRRYQDVWLPIQGIGGYREANVNGAVNLTRAGDRVEIGVYAAHAVEDAVVTLSGIDGVWWRRVANLAPDKPLRETIARAPGRMPLELQVTDAQGRVLIRLDDQPDPGLRREPMFAGTSLWKTDPLRDALRAEQYFPLWRGGTGGYRPLAQYGAAAYRKLLAEDSENLEARLGLARTLMVDAQLRGPDRPGCGTAEAVAVFQAQQLAAAMEALAPVIEAPRAALLAGEVTWRQGDAQASRGFFAQASENALAQFGLARALAALGERDRAAPSAHLAARVLPGSPPAAQLAAGIAILRHAPAEAIEILRLMHRHDPLDPVTLTLLAQANEMAGHTERADAFETQIQALRTQTDEPIDIPDALRRLGLEALTQATPNG